MPTLQHLSSTPPYVQAGSLGRMGAHRGNGKVYLDYSTSAVHRPVFDSALSIGSSAAPVLGPSSLNMLGSFLEGAKATVRRAGASDLGADSSIGGERNSPRRVQAAVAHQESSPSVEQGGRGEDNSSAAQSVSRSFSLLKASGARAMLPVKKALGGDPEVIQARESLTKYKAKMSAAVAEAAAAAATRREERELLTRALAGQENDLRCWGYLSVLPSFREHRRKETSRAQLLVSMAERREEVMSAKLQEVVRLLRSLPIIGPWTNKQRPMDTAVAGGGGGGGGNNSGNLNYGFRNGRFCEEEFAVAPADLLAFDEELALARRRLVSYDRECAAAADAFAMKVVAAGGLEPRSSEDRTQTLLSLLSRYHVLGDETVAAGCSDSSGEPEQPPAAGGKDEVEEEVVQPEEKEKEDKNKEEEEEEGEEEEERDLGKEATAADVSSDSDKKETTAAAANAAVAAADARENQTEQEQGGGGGGSTPDDKSSDDATTTMTTTVAEPEGGQNGDGEARSKTQEEAAESLQEATEQKERGVAAKQAEGGARDSEPVQELDDDVGRGGEIESTGEIEIGIGDIGIGTGIGQKTDDTAGKKAADAETVRTTPGREAEKATAIAMVDDDDDDGGGESAACRRPQAAVRAGFSTRSREECEEAFVELMLDERNREGRLLRRFLTMAQARNSPAVVSVSAPPPPPRPLPAAAHAKPNPRRPAGGGVGASVGYFADAAAGAFSSMRARVRGGASGHDGASGAGDGGGGWAAASAAGEADPANTGSVVGAGGAGTATRRGRSAAAVETAAVGERRPGGGRGKGHEEKGEEDWDGSVGPQVVKAFINYFSKEYLVNKFHVPDVLVPSLTELVGLLVFRQARRLVFGYDRRRVMESDLAWREKARTVRSACLLELGAPPEYVPASRTNASSGTRGTEAQAAATTAPEARAGKREECERDGRPDEAAVSADAAGSARPPPPPDDAAGRGGGVSSSGGTAAAAALPTAAVPPEPTRAALSDGAEVTPAGVAGAPASPPGGGGLSPAPEDGKATTGEHGEKTTASASCVGVAVASAAKKEQDQDQEAAAAAAEEGEGSAYARASQEFERLGACTTPAGILGVVRAGMKSLCDAAAGISGSDKPLDADTLLPLLVHALVRADLPRVHEALNFLRNFRGPSWGGEEAYYVTCIEAAVSFVLDWRPAADETGLSAAAAAATEVDDDAVATALQVGPNTAVNDGGDGCGSKTSTRAPAAAPRRRDGGGGGDVHGNDAAVSAKRAERAKEEEREQQEKGREALLRLGIFLEKHEVQEDTVDVLSSAGWL